MLRSSMITRCSSVMSLFEQHSSMSIPFAFPSFSYLVEPSPQDIGAIRYRSNRSRRGLYNGKDIQTGNNVSFSMRSTKRKFKPNVFSKRVYSEILDEMVRFHLTASTLRSIDKAGGLDNYLLTSKYVTSGEGKEVKDRILGKLAYEERQRKRAESMDASD